MNKLVFLKFKELSYAVSEALNTLCTNLTFMGNSKKVIAVTSCTAHEGKSYVTMNMMRTLAQLGHKVLLIDADLRRSMISVKYGVKIEKGNGEGLSHYLAEMCSLDEVTYETDIPGAYMIPVGHEVSNSLALLSTPRLEQMMKKLREEYEYILVDVPPVGAIIDAAEIAKHCDGTFFVVKYNAIGRKELQEAKRQMERAGSTILGAVLNNVELDSLSSKKYYNKTYYTHYDTEYYKPPQKKKKAVQAK